MSLDNTPAPQIAHASHGLGMPAGLVYSGAPENTSGLVVLSPPPQPAAQGARRQRAVGLIPAKAGSLHPMITRQAPRERINPGDVSKARSALRAAKKTAAVKEAVWLATVNGSEEHKKAAIESREANDLIAACIRKLAEMEASSASRPLVVVTAVVREPSEVADEIANGEPRYLCLHDGCRQANPDGWPDESAMRRAHPTDNEMKRAQQCHVFVVYCDAPLDPLDPDGDRIGYVAPVGSDGAPIAAVAAKAEEDGDRDAELADLKAQVAELRALIEGDSKPKK